MTNTENTPGFVDVTEANAHLINWENSPGFTLVKDAAHLAEILDAATNKGTDNVPTAPATITYTVLYDGGNNENSNSAKSPVAEWTGQVDLEATVTQCLYWDDDRLVTVKRYALKQVTLPAWLPLNEWIRTYITWSYVWGFGADPVWPEAWQRGLGTMGEVERLAVIGLLKTKNFRNPFRKSLRDQIVAWFETPGDERKFGSPLSRNQWNALIRQRTVWEARQRSAGLYSSHRYSEAGGIKPF